MIIIINISNYSNYRSPDLDKKKTGFKMFSYRDLYKVFNVQTSLPQRRCYYCSKCIISYMHGCLVMHPHVTHRREKPVVDIQWSVSAKLLIFGSVTAGWWVIRPSTLFSLSVRVLKKDIWRDYKNTSVFTANQAEEGAVRWRECTKTSTVWFSEIKKVILSCLERTLLCMKYPTVVEDLQMTIS